MKRTILFSLAISCAGFILAQDIVVTKAGTTIEDVTVVSVTADNVVYKQGSSVNTISSSEVDGVLYSDGRYITPPRQQTMQAENTATPDGSWSMDDTSEKRTAQQANTQTGNHVVIELLYMDKSYSKECRKAGAKVFNEACAIEYKKLKQARKSMTKEEFKAADAAALERVINASNDAVLECSGLKNSNSTQLENDSSW